MNVLPDLCDNCVQMMQLEPEPQEAETEEEKEGEQVRHKVFNTDFVAYERHQYGPVSLCKEPWWGKVGHYVILQEPRPTLDVAGEGARGQVSDNVFHDWLCCTSIEPLEEVVIATSLCATNTSSYCRVRSCQRSCWGKGRAHR